MVGAVAGADSATPRCDLQPVCAESPRYGRILGHTCVATIRTIVALEGSMLGSWALSLGRWNLSVPFSFALPHDKCARAHAFIALSLCGCELVSFCTFWARIPTLRRDSGPQLSGDNSRHWGPRGVNVGILGADIGPPGTSLSQRGPTKSARRPRRQTAMIT